MLGYEPLPVEAIGFPFEIWNESKTYRGFIVDYRAMGMNTLFALLPGITFGVIGVWFRDNFNQHLHKFEQQEANAKQLNLQLNI